MDDQPQYQPDEVTTPKDQDGVEPMPPKPETVTITWPADATKPTLSYQVPKCRLDWDMNVQFDYEDGRRLRAMMTLLGGGPAGVPRVRRELYTGGVSTAGDLNDFLNHAADVCEKLCSDQRDVITDDEPSK